MPHADFTAIRLALTGPLLALVLVASPAQGKDAAALCHDAAALAAAETGVPAALLTAIMLTETGRRRDGVWQPWPWAVHAEGRGTWHAGRDAALAAVRATIAGGDRNVDVGCFQINHRWHGDAFADKAEMLDPVANARHAALFLRELHAEFGDWLLAAGAYHSRTPALASAYRARVAVHLAAAHPAPVPSAGQAFPLLRGARTTAGASLMPAETQLRPLLGGPGRPIFDRG